MKLLIINDGSDYSNWGIQACIDGLSSHFIKFFNKVDTVKHIIIHQIFYRLVKCNIRVKCIRAYYCSWITN